MSSFSKNEFRASPDCDPMLAEIAETAFGEFIANYKVIGWNLKLEGFTVVVTDPDGRSSSYELTLERVAPVMRDQLYRVYKLWAARHNPPPSPR